jgi:hypothetical protein
MLDMDNRGARGAGDAAGSAVPKAARSAIGVCALESGGKGNLASFSSITRGSYCELLSVYVDV